MTAVAGDCRSPRAGDEQSAIPEPTRRRRTRDAARADLPGDRSVQRGLWPSTRARWSPTTAGARRTVSRDSSTAPSATCAPRGRSRRMPGSRSRHSAASTNGEVTTRRRPRWYAQATETLARCRSRSPLYAGPGALPSGHSSGAREPLRLALRTDDSMVRAHFLLGLVQRDSQEIAEAIASLEHTVRLSPALPAAREELADLYRSLGQLDNERAQLMALAIADPQLSRSMAVALAAIRAGDLPAARQMLVGLAASSPGDSRVALALGRLYLASAERDGDTRSVTLALAALEQALAGTARRSEGLALYGRALVSVRRCRRRRTAPARGDRDHAGRPRSVRVSRRRRRIPRSHGHRARGTARASTRSKATPFRSMSARPHATARRPRSRSRRCPTAAGC